MARSKRRTPNQIAEDTSYSILRELLPSEWVVHDYKPDYGVDLVVEVFQKLECGSDYQTLGEHLFVQLKSVARAMKVRKVEKHLQASAARPDEATESEQTCQFDIVKFVVDTDLLHLAGSMGGIPLVLIVVYLQEKRAFFICLNDYFDKIVIPSCIDTENQKTLTIEIPLANEILPELGAQPLAWYAKRPKLLSAFLRFEYQRSAMESSVRHDMSIKELGHEIVGKRMLLFSQMLRDLLRLDIWSSMNIWPAWANLREFALRVQYKVEAPTPKTPHDCLVAECGIITIWENLVALGHCYEEVCREWFLPTVLGQLCSLSEDS